MQTSRLSAAKAETITLETERDVAIEAHDALVKEVDRQRRIVADREIARQQQEKDYEKLQRTITAALQNNRIWAGTKLPDSVRETVHTMFQAAPVDTSKPDNPNPAPASPGR